MLTEAVEMLRAQIKPERMCGVGMLLDIRYAEYGLGNNVVVTKVCVSV